MMAKDVSKSSVVLGRGGHTRLKNGPKEPSAVGLEGPNTRDQELDEFDWPKLFA